MIALPEPALRPPAPAQDKFRLLGHLSRITTAGRNFIPQIDGLRFIAIMAVIAYHAQGVALYHFGLVDAPGPPPSDLVSQVFESGHYGVQLFFAISGLILSLPFARQWICGEQPVSLRRYYLRRVTRIEPPYVIHLFVLLVLCAIVYRRLPAYPDLYHNPGWAGYALSHILASLVYANGFIFGSHPYPNIVLWSLEVEVQFYLLAPFLARMFRIPCASKRRALFIGLILVLSTTSIFAQSYRTTFSLAGNLQYFLVGFLLADLYVTGCLAAPTRNYYWDFALLLSCAIVVWGRTDRVMNILLPWAIFVSGLSAFRGIASSLFLGNPWVATIGGMCYTLYLYHRLLLSVLIRLTGKLRVHVLPLDLLVQFVLMSLGIIVISAVLFALFERPFMRSDWPARFWKTARRMGKPEPA